MEYNGGTQTWTQFKHYWASKSSGGWLYDDLKGPLRQEDVRRMENAWVIAGPIFCDKQKIQYVDYNQAQQQKTLAKGKTHFIFVLDSSGSMEGSSWNDLIRALGEIMVKLNSYIREGAEVYVTIINFAIQARTIK